MDAREELLKLTLGKIVTGVLLLVGFLFAIVWRETLFQKWSQVAEGLSKPALLAMLGLALIGLLLELLGIAYLLWLLYRNRSTNAAKPEMVKRFGVHWDKELNPHCPVDNTLMRPRIHASNRDYDILECPKCDHKYPLRAEDQSSLMLPAAQRLIENRGSDLITKPQMQKHYGLLWDSDLNPHCPVDETVLSMHDHYRTERGSWADKLNCPKCTMVYAVRLNNGQVTTLIAAQASIRYERNSD